MPFTEANKHALGRLRNILATSYSAFDNLHRLASIPTEERSTSSGSWTQYEQPSCTPNDPRQGKWWLLARQLGTQRSLRRFAVRLGTGTDSLINPQGMGSTAVL